MITLANEGFHTCVSTGIARLELNRLRSELCSLCSSQVMMTAKINLDEAVSMKCDNRTEGGITPGIRCTSFCTSENSSATINPAPKRDPWLCE